MPDPLGADLHARRGRASLSTVCGIGGILRRDGQPVPESWLDMIDARLRHRGPDGAGRFRDRVEADDLTNQEPVEIALVHRRLSILDRAGGGQPMVSERGRNETEGLIAVVFNGCIYNHRELRAELESAGHVFQSDHSDTEVLIHGYREWGSDLADRLEGMYAFALWDRTRRALVLARDWFGEKPLYVRWGIDDNERIVAFSSDALALAYLDSDGAMRCNAPPRGWTTRYLQLGYGYEGLTSIHCGATAVRNLPPTITERIDHLLPRRPRETHSQQAFEALVQQAVERRLDADVPLGCFLSGGVDSSLVAHFAKEAAGHLRTFSVKMPDERYDESTHAAKVAEHLGTEHTTLSVAMNPAEDLVELVRLVGQPFADSSILPTYWVSRAARKHVTVVLSGDGGDELFMGYERYLAARHLNRHRRLLQWMPRRFMRRAHPKSLRFKIGRLGEMARDLRRVGIIAMESIFTQAQIRDLFGHVPDSPFIWPSGGDPMQSLRRFDLISYLPDDLLMKVDTASMAVALEVRCPFLDRDLVAAALAAPTWQLAPDGRRKGLIRAIARKYLPATIVDRPKMGFAIPIGEWFRRDFGGMRSLLELHLLNDDVLERYGLRLPAVRRLVEEHLAAEYDHSHRIFALLTLGIWTRTFVE